MSSSSLGRGIGAGTDGRDASEKHQRDFIPANVVTHEKVTEGHELLASEGLCEEIGGIVVGPDMEHFQQASSRRGVRTCGSRSSPGVRSRAVGESVGQISHIAGPHPLSLGVRRYPLFPLGEKQTSPPPLCGAEWEWLG